MKCLINSSLCLLSYNSRGFSSIKQDFCRFITSKEIVGDSIPLLFNQENFVLKANTSKLVNALPGFHLVVKPAVIGSYDAGRPMNGMFFAIPKQYKSMVKMCLLITGAFKLLL